MAFALDLQIRNARDVKTSLLQLAKDFGLAVNFVTADQLRLWVLDLMSPRVKVPAKGSHGKRAVSDDIEEIIAPIPPYAEVIDAGDKHIIKIDGGPLWAVELGGVTAGENIMDSTHARLRDNRGRVRRRGPKVSKRGALTFVNKLHVKQAAYRRFVRKKKADVGQLKRGWEDALKKLSAFVNAGAATPPAWIRKAPKVPGEAETNMKDGNGRVSATNAVPYADFKYESWLPATRRKRQKDIRGAMRKRSDDLIRRFNAGKI